MINYGNRKKKKKQNKPRTKLFFERVRGIIEYRRISVSTSILYYWHFLKCGKNYFKNHDGTLLLQKPFSECGVDILSSFKEIFLSIPLTGDG